MTSAELSKDKPGVAELEPTLHYFGFQAKEGQ